MKLYVTKQDIDALMSCSFIVSLIKYGNKSNDETFIYLSRNEIK